MFLITICYLRSHVRQIWQTESHIHLYVHTSCIRFRLCILSHHRMADFLPFSHWILNRWNMQPYVCSSVRDHRCIFACWWYCYDCRELYQPITVLDIQIYIPFFFFKYENKCLKNSNDKFNISLEYFVVWSFLASTFEKSSFYGSKRDISCVAKMGTFYNGLGLTENSKNIYYYH